MARNDIRLRRQLIDEDTLQRHRNYSLLLKQHQQGKRKKRIRTFFIFTIIVAVVTVLLLILFSYLAVKLQKERLKPATKSTMLDQKKSKQVCDFLKPTAL